MSKRRHRGNKTFVRYCDGEWISLESLAKGYKRDPVDLINKYHALRRANKPAEWRDILNRDPGLLIIVDDRLLTQREHAEVLGISYTAYRKRKSNEKHKQEVTEKTGDGNAEWDALDDNDDQVSVDDITQITEMEMELWKIGSQ